MNVNSPTESRPFIRVEPY